MRRNFLRQYSIFVLIGVCLVALSLPRFGFLWHTHMGGEATHTHDVYTLAHETHAPHTHYPAPHGHGHSRTHDHKHDHGHPHDPAADVEGRFVDATPHGLHAHYFDDSLPAGFYLLPLPTLVIRTVVLYSCRGESPSARYLIPPTARAPPA
jgi:hypothetical protein